MPESERSDENGMVILSRVDACAPPYPTMYTGSGDVKQKRRARRPEGEEWSEAGIRNLRQQVKYALRFFVVETALHQNPKHLSLSPPSRTAASASSQAGQSNKTKREYLLFLLTHHPPTRYAVASENHKKPTQHPHPSPPHSSPTLRSGQAGDERLDETRS